MAIKRPVKITLKRTGENYVVAQLINAISVTIVDRGQTFKVGIGNTLVEREAEELARQFAVTVR